MARLSIASLWALIGLCCLSSPVLAGLLSPFMRPNSISEGCRNFGAALCVGEEHDIIARPASPDNLTGWWDFDSAYPVDKSGNGNHGLSTFTAGPSRTGQGSSVSFTDGESLIIPNNSSLNSSTFTLSFWVYVIDNSSEKFVSLVSKGTETVLTPSVWLYPTSGRISARVTTELKSTEGLSSRGLIAFERWSHVAGKIWTSYC